ncbi:hypothetical protein ACFX12_020056 [Malus domestica]
MFEHKNFSNELKRFIPEWKHNCNDLNSDVKISMTSIMCHVTSKKVSYYGYTLREDLLEEDIILEQKVHEIRHGKESFGLCSAGFVDFGSRDMKRLRWGSGIEGRASSIGFLGFGLGSSEVRWCRNISRFLDANLEGEVKLGVGAENEVREA